MRARTEERVEKAEEMLCAGLSPGRVEQALAREYQVSPRKARAYMTRVYARWSQQNAADAPHRREKVLRMAERFYAKALLEKQYTAAANALNLLARMSGAFTQEHSRESALALLGPVPTDPTQALLYAQRALIVALNEVIANPALDPEKRLHWIAEIGGKIGTTHAKALVQHKLEAVAAQFLPQPDDDEQQDNATIDAAEWDRLKDA